MSIVIRANFLKQTQRGIGNMAKKLTSGKAKKILSDNSVRGHVLTRKQQKFFGAVAGGATPRNPSPPYGRESGTQLCHYGRGKLGVG